MRAGARHVMKYHSRMDRRNFLRTSAVASATLIAGVRPAFAADTEIEITPQDGASEISPHLGWTNGLFEAMQGGHRSPIDGLSVHY
jgi:hypothetical protein